MFFMSSFQSSFGPHLIVIGICVYVERETAARVVDLYEPGSLRRA